MYRKIIDKLRDKNICILGFGREGKSTYKFIRKYLKEQVITIVDLNDISIDDDLVNVVCGDNYLDNLERFDLIIKSPGISLKDIDTSKIINKITSQLELLLEINSKNIIGITGTKGKSTTSTLTYMVLKDQLKDVYLLGNIGVPVFDEIENYNDNTKLVIEMSSHQLEYIKYSPHIGVILNLYQDHLDHTGTLEHYHSNKMNMFKYQSKDDFSIYSSDNSYLIDRINSYNYLGIKYTVRFDNLELSDNSVRIRDNHIYINNQDVYNDDGARLLHGEHNLKNIMFVMSVVYIMGLDANRAKSVIDSFIGLKYRMEYIGKYHEIDFYNDTIATIPIATINAIETIGNVDTLIFGGMDRGIDYDEFITYLEKSKISNLICMPTTGTNIGKELEKRCSKNIIYCDTLEDAYKLSVKNTSSGMSVLLSPAAASYEFFKNFEEKGAAFEEIVKNN